MFHNGKIAQICIPLQIHEICDIQYSQKVQSIPGVYSVRSWPLPLHPLTWQLPPLTSSHCSTPITSLPNNSSSIPPNLPPFLSFTLSFTFPLTLPRANARPSLKENRKMVKTIKRYLFSLSPVQISLFSKELGWSEGEIGALRLRKKYWSMERCWECGWMEFESRFGKRVGNRLWLSKRSWLSVLEVDLRWSLRLWVQVGIGCGLRVDLRLGFWDCEAESVCG